MPRILQDLIAFVVYLLFAAIEYVVEWGMFVVAFGLPVYVVVLLGAKVGDTWSMLGLLVGLGLMLLWYTFLDNGAGKRWEKLIRDLTHRTIRALGAGDAIF